jgi:UDP-2,4-diacetamido-2,4,6-trideoxy-beta-L-altropyranose hydrolase
LRIVYRADASVELGTGHVMRCLALAEALRGRAEQAFVACSGPGDAHEKVRAAGFPLLSPAEDFKAAVQSWSPSGVDVAVVDHYGLGAEWEGQARAVARRIVVIDDLANRKHDCDLLLDQNIIGGDGSVYDGLVPAHARRLIGPRFALLRREFAVERPRIRTELRRVFVFFGGADAVNETGKALAALEDPRLARLHATVVVGGSNPRASEIEARCAGRPRWRFVRDARDVARLMAETDLALGAGGSTSWERCATGLPTILVATAENQERPARMLAASGAAVYLGLSTETDARAWADAVVAFASDAKRLKAMSEAAAQVVAGGETTKRVTHAILELVTGRGVDFRPATPDDAPLLRAWRNDPETRRWSFTSNEVRSDEHAAWLRKVLADPNRRLLIAFARDGQPVGTVRVDALDAPACELSWTVAPEARGRGLGKEMVRAAAHGLGGELVARIKNGNTASERIAAFAGFVKEADDNGNMLWRARLGAPGPLRA